MLNKKYIHTYIYIYITLFVNLHPCKGSFNIACRCVCLVCKVPKGPSGARVFLFSKSVALKLQSGFPMLFRSRLCSCLLFLCQGAPVGFRRIGCLHSSANGKLSTLFADSVALRLKGGLWSNGGSETSRAPWRLPTYLHGIALRLREADLVV